MQDPSLLAYVPSDAHFISLVLKVHAYPALVSKGEMGISGRHPTKVEMYQPGKFGMCLDVADPFERKA
jgi:hypothetical protein